MSRSASRQINRPEPGPTRAEKEREKENQIEWHEAKAVESKSMFLYLIDSQIIDNFVFGTRRASVKFVFHSVVHSPDHIQKRMADLLRIQDCAAFFLCSHSMSSSLSFLCRSSSSVVGDCNFVAIERITRNS